MAQNTQSSIIWATGGLMSPFTNVNQNRESANHMSY